MRRGPILVVLSAISCIPNALSGDDYVDAGTSEPVCPAAYDCILKDADRESTESQSVLDAGDATQDRSDAGDATIADEEWYVSDAAVSDQWQASDMSVDAPTDGADAPQDDVAPSDGASEALLPEVSDGVDAGQWPPPGSFEGLGAPGCLQTLAVWDPMDPWGVGCQGYGAGFGSIYELEDRDGGMIWSELDSGLWIDVAYPPDSKPWAIDYQTARVWRWNDTQQSFSQVGNLIGAFNVRVGRNNQAWAISGDGTNDSVNRWNGTSWDLVPSANPWQLAVSPVGTAWLVTAPDYQISYWNSTAWTPLDPQPPGGCAQSIAVDDHGHVWAIACSPPFTNGKVMTLGPSGWVTVPGPGATQVTLDSNGLPWIVSSVGGTVYHWVPTSIANDE
jgi:hypothetical protein